jgi:hypothetical protein
MAVDPKRRRIAQAARDIQSGLKDTDRRGTPSDVPTKSVASRLRGVSDELGVTTPKAASRSSAGLKKAPRSKPRKAR